MNDRQNGPSATEADRSWKRRIETGVESLIGDGRMKSLLAEMKLPREIVNHILGQVDETKHAAIKAIARETREFLERTNIADELAGLLTQVTLRIDLKFVRNEDPPPTRRRKAARTGGRGGDDPPPDPAVNPAGSS